ncbi:MAG: acyl carrier protein [Pirellulales bacterium]
MKPAVSEAVIAAINTVLRDTGRDTKPVESAMLLAADIGLDSLDLAQTIVLLERSLGVDPFRSPSAARPSVRTVSDLISIYTQALGHS